MNQAKPNILLVDDSEVNLEILKDSLSKYNTITASDGESALEMAFSREKPDLILLDIVMPGMSGYEVCKFLKENELTKDIPVIFITGQDDMDSIIKGFEAGAIDFITKPFNILELRARVKTQVTIKMARDQNKRLMQKIEAINIKLTDSIRYAKKIQKASLPKKEEMDRLLPEYFVMYKPRDIVSGDFYWANKVNGKTIVVVADCTGHGVPGAFMSMFGIAYLHEIISDNGETEPGRILDRLREIVIHSLQQEENSEVKDGMDVCIISIDKSRKELKFAGAFNPLFIIKDHQIEVLPADHMPVSIGEIDRPFATQTITYDEGTCLYLHTDGYSSQFGGPKNKKLMQKGFKQLLLDHHHKSMAEQKSIFEDHFLNWKGLNEQVDDILILGIRL